MVILLRILSIADDSLFVNKIIQSTSEWEVVLILYIIILPRSNWCLKFSIVLLKHQHEFHLYGNICVFFCGISRYDLFKNNNGNEKPQKPLKFIFLSILVVLEK